MKISELRQIAEAIDSNHRNDEMLQPTPFGKIICVCGLNDLARALEALERI